MSHLYIKKVLGFTQNDVFVKLGALRGVGVMAGGTALAFQLGHRKSYDFNIFTAKHLPSNLSWEIRKIFGRKIEALRESDIDFTFLTPKKIKITFYHYPFKPLYKVVKTGSLPIFHWKDIAADKAYTLGRRPMYRDYADIFFILKNGYDLKQIISDAKRKFEGLFSEKIFLAQLTYFGDLKDFSIEFLRESYKPQEIKSFLEKAVREYLKKKL